MSEDATEQNAKQVRCVSEITAAYVTNNRVPRSDLPAFIAVVNRAIANLGAPRAIDPIVRPTETEIRQFIKRDSLISFIDGKLYKALRRHLLFNSHTAESYRVHYGLPVDYPMVAASYSERRTELSRQNMANRRRSAEGRTLQ